MPVGPHVDQEVAGRDWIGEGFKTLYQPAEFETRLRGRGFDRIEMVKVDDWLRTRFNGRFSCPTGPSQVA